MWKDHIVYQSRPESLRGLTTRVASNPTDVKSTVGDGVLRIVGRTGPSVEPDGTSSVRR